MGDHSFCKGWQHTCSHESNEFGPHSMASMASPTQPNSAQASLCPELSTNTDKLCFLLPHFPLSIVQSLPSSYLCEALMIATNFTSFKLAIVLITILMRSKSQVFYDCVTLS